MGASTPKAPTKREGFSSRRVFIFAAIGSAVGLGNIWRFPYIAFDNGGGAFMIPYIVALLTAGLTFLFFDYAIGHRARASSPLAFRRLNRKTEFIGWWHMGINFVIAIYYAAIVAWALRYMVFSFTNEWGDNPKAFFQGEFLKVAKDPGVSLDFNMNILIPMVLVWGVLLAVMALGVQKGVGAANIIFIPLLLVMFVGLVIYSLTLPGAVDGLNALFTPSWDSLANPDVWVAAYGQIFFSLSIGFGIMVTYSSYLKPKTDLTGSGAVVGFANSGFELLAGIGVFAALGFMAQAAGTQVSEVATSGIGLAFIAFPTIISQAPGGVLIGIQAMTSSFYPNQTDFLFCDIFRKGTDGIGATTNTGNHIVWQTTFFFQDLTFRLFADHFLEFMHNGWVRVRSNSRTQNIKSIEVCHPCSKSSINGVFQGLGSCFNRMNGCPHHFHAEDIQALAFDVFCPHVDITGHAKLSCRSCCSHTVLTSSCFSNHARFAHALSQEDLPQDVI